MRKLIRCAVGALAREGVHMTNVVQFSKQKRPASFGKVLVVAVSAAFISGGAFAWFALDLRALETTAGTAIAAVQVGRTREAPSFELCSGSVRINCVVDGDNLLAGRCEDANSGHRHAGSIRAEVCF